MRKVSSLIALALLAVAGTSYALTCTYDNVPAATLLVPYFRVSNNGVTTANQPIPTVAGETDTLMAITNVSANGLIVHATVWNKYSAAVLDYNIPLTGYDVVYFSAKQILNGQLNANLKTITFWRNQGKISKTTDPCNTTAGLGQFSFVRFTNPDTTDAGRSISIYADPAYTGAFREKVWDSLDESGDINEWQDATNSFILDADNPACGDNSDGHISGDFSGYITFDVANYCTNHFPDEATYYTNDAIATRGWPTNALIGDVFYIEYASSGNISGDQMIPLEFDAGLDWRQTKTFYSRYNNVTSDFPATNANVPDAYEFTGDGREALGQHYGFRYFNIATASGTPNINTWLLVWRSDRFDDGTNNLCGWYYGDAYGFEESPVGIVVYDDDENSFTPGGGPSGGPAGKDIYIFLEAQRIDLFNSSAQWNVGGYTLGWIDLDLGKGRSEYNQAWVGVQHSGAAAFLSVGHGAAQLSQGSNCTSILD